jgi:hypothetical protein
MRDAGEGPRRREVCGLVESRIFASNARTPRSRVVACDTVIVGPSSVSRVRRLRFIVGALACVVLPAGSRLQGTGMLAWTMYSRTGEFRIDLVAFDAAGRAHLRNPTVLAAGASSDVASLLAGSDHWRQAASVAALREHLHDLAGHACRELNAASVVVTLHERRGSHSEVATTCERVCEPR